jgi:hypothetical protein
MIFFPDRDYDIGKSQKRPLAESKFERMFDDSFTDDEM